MLFKKSERFVVVIIKTIYLKVKHKIILFLLLSYKRLKKYIYES